MEFAKQKTFTGVSRLLPRAHWEARRGTREQARDYARKEDTRVEGPWEFGDWIDGPGARTDLLSLKADIDAGADDTRLWQDHFGLMCRNTRAVQAYRSAKCATGRDARKRPEAIVFWGYTGVGKSRRVRQLAGKDAYWVSNPGRSQSVWFDGYMGQSTLVFDDFYGWMPWSQLLRIIDRYPFNLNCKGSSSACCATRFFFTSNQHPSMWYPKMPYGTLERRLSAIIDVSTEIEFSDSDEDEPTSALGPFLIAQ